MVFKFTDKFKELVLDNKAGLESIGDDEAWLKDLTIRIKLEETETKIYLLTEDNKEVAYMTIPQGRETVGDITLYNFLVKTKVTISL